MSIATVARKILRHFEKKLTPTISSSRMIAGFCCACVLCFLASSKAHADTIDSGTGYASNVSVGAEGSLNVGDGISNYPSPILVQSSPGQTYSANQSASAGGAAGSVSVSIAPNNGNIGLHGSATSNAVTYSKSFADFDLYYYDLFTATGTGSETFMYTLALDGNASLTGDPDDSPFSSTYGGLSLYANSSYQTWGDVAPDGCDEGPDCGLLNQIGMSNTNNPNGGSVTGDITLEAGQSIELGLYLWARPSTYSYPPAGAEENPGSPDVTATFDASDTGFFTLTPVTPGAGFTTASGLTYASDPDSVAATPEPSSLLLLGTGILGAAGVIGRRLRHTGTNAGEPSAA